MNLNNVKGGMEMSNPIIPDHYHKNGIDVIGFAEMQLPKEHLIGFCRINVLKYLTRYDRKNGVEDLYKASEYLNKLIELESNGNELS